jgi:hypothetical protein
MVGFIRNNFWACREWILKQVQDDKNEQLDNSLRVFSLDPEINSGLLGCAQALRHCGSPLRKLWAVGPS